MFFTLGKMQLILDSSVVSYLYNICMYTNIHKETPVFKQSISSKIHTNEPKIMLRVVSGNI